MFVRGILIPVLMTAYCVSAPAQLYVKKATWLESFEDYCNQQEKLSLSTSETSRKPKLPTGAVLAKGGEEAQKISFDLSGSKALVLLAGDAGDGKNCDHSVWVNAKLIDKKGREVWLDEMKPRQKEVGAKSYVAKKKDKKNPVIIGSKKYQRYIFAHAPSKLAYKLKGKYVRFEAEVGIDQRERQGQGSVLFSVSNDPGKETEGTDDAVLKQLIADFPNKSIEIMVVKDWHRQDGLNMFSIHNDYEPPAKATLEQAGKTLAYVKKAGADDAKLEARLQALERQSARGGNWKSLWLQAHILRRQMILSHPALDFDRMLINVNPPTKYSHNGDQHLGRHSRVGPGLGILSNWKSGNARMNFFLKGKLPEGAYRNPDLHYDARRVVFAFCDHSRTDDPNALRYFLYEAALDGSSVRQLTGTRRDLFQTNNNRATVIIEDNDPCYLPDDHIIFISTRCQSFGRCHGGRYNPAWVLHRCDPAGGHIRQLSYNNENEYEPSVLNDGRIIYTRWEYTNRHEMFFHMLWWCRPDGTAPTQYYGNDTIIPMEVVEATAIPGSTRIMATAQGHHSYNTGTTVLIDVNKGENGEAPITHLTPETPYSESGGWPDPHYSHPYPLTEDLFLASRANHRVHKQGMVPPPNDRGIYLVDPVGGRELIYEHPDYASFSPIPVRPRKRPPVIPSSLPPKAKPEGTVFLQNIYLTRNDPEGIIKPGMIKALRINALGVQPRHQKHTVCMTVKNEIPKRVVGTVPVNPDGSAVFKVPADTSLQMQALDENGMAILTEKSFFYLQPGETRSCIGCHEPEGSSPNMRAVAGLSRMKPVVPKPPAGPQYPGGMSFIRTVQPVLDRYCIGCHGLDQASANNSAANKINLIHDGKDWPRSYQELVKRGEHHVGLKAYMGGKNEEYNISRPRRFYAYRNKVSHMLVENHGKCNMDHDSYMRIIEFLDLNAQCYGDLFPGRVEDRKIDKQGFKAVEALAKQLFGDTFAGQPERALVNTVQVDESRILMAPLPKEAGGWGQLKGYTGKDDPNYKKMAALIDKAIIREPNENTNGWEPTLVMGGGEEWVMEYRDQYKKEVGIKK